MKTTLVLVAILSMNTTGWGQSLTIKGHHLGESMEEFFRSEPAIQAHMELCKKLALGDKAYELSLTHVPGQPIPYDIALERYLLKDKKGRVYLDDAAIRRDSQEYNSQHCFQLMLRPFGRDGHLLQTINNLNISDKDTLVEWFSKDGIMWRMSLTTTRDTYEQVRDDFTKRIGGAPISERLIPKHNAYGATWSDPNADWLTAEVHAHLSQTENPAEPGSPWLEIETRAAFDEQVQKIKARPSPLD